MKTDIQNLSGFERILAVSEENRFGVIAVALLIVGCLGGVTVGLGAINNILALTFVVIPTMTTLSFLLAIAPMRWIYYAGISSVVIDTLLIIFYILN
ncbi:MAG: hypothetical protein HYR91_09220 [Flavobacteriia bacterium]|nr:hypothetical protein [Flavobacteriia bacterium]